MEEIRRVQKAFAIPDAELRDTLREDNREFVMPFYTAFLKRYGTVPFSRNPEKYIKYSAEDVRQFIDGFFDAASWTVTSICRWPETAIAGQLLHTLTLTHRDG